MDVLFAIFAIMFFTALLLAKVKRNEGCPVLPQVVLGFPTVCVDPLDSVSNYYMAEQQINNTMRDIFSKMEKTSRLPQVVLGFPPIYGKQCK